LEIGHGIRRIQGKGRWCTMQPSEGLFDISDPYCVLECNKVVDIGDVKVVSSMNLHDDEGHKMPNELRAMVGMKVSKYLSMCLKGG